MSLGHGYGPVSETQRLIDEREAAVAETTQRVEATLRKIEEEARRLDDKIGSAMLVIQAADRLADEVHRLVENQRIDARSEAADALLDYNDLNSHRDVLGLERREGL